MSELTLVPVDTLRTLLEVSAHFSLVPSIRSKVTNEIAFLIFVQFVGGIMAYKALMVENTT